MKYLFLILLTVMTYAWSAEDLYTFKSPKEQTRFQELTSELRCLVCQNQNLNESNAALANDLREQIYQKIKNGESNQQIITFLVDRYGDFILYRPPLKFGTVILWFGPIIILLAALGYFMVYLRSKIRESS